MTHRFTTIKLMTPFLTIFLSSCGSFVGEVLAPTVTDTQIGLSGKGTSSVITNSKQTVKEQEKLKKKVNAPHVVASASHPTDNMSVLHVKVQGNIPNPVTQRQNKLLLNSNEQSAAHNENALYQQSIFKSRQTLSHFIPHRENHLQLYETLFQFHIRSIIKR